MPLLDFFKAFVVPRRIAQLIRHSELEGNSSRQVAWIGLRPAPDVCGLGARLELINRLPYTTDCYPSRKILRYIYLSMGGLHCGKGSSHTTLA
ncbi:hypothetical protein D3C72_1974030 [compost metagenome]